MPGSDRGLVKNTQWMIAGYATKTVVQAGYFIIIARTLGASGYGAFVGVVALIAIVAPFGGIGTGNLLIRAVARDESEFATRWGDTLIVSTLSGAAFLSVLLAVSATFFHATFPPAIVLLVGMADLIAARILEAAGQAFQAFHRLNRTATLQALPMIFRFVAAVLLIVLPHASVALWAVLYCVSMVAACAYGVLAVNRELGVPHFHLGRARRDLREGVHFSVGLAAQNVYNDIDKAMLAQMSGAAPAGIYAAAYRIIDVAFTPVRALLNASYPTFFRLGADGLRGTLGLLRKIAPIACGYAAVAAVLMIVGAPLLPLILGHQYEQTSTVLRWLAVLPLIKAAQYVVADALTGAGYQRARSRAQIAVAIVNVALNLILIPAYSLRGAIWASLLSDGLLAAALWAIAFWLLHYRRPILTAPLSEAGSEGLHT